MKEGLVGPAHEYCHRCVEKGRKKYGDSGGYKSICKKQAYEKYPPLGSKMPDLPTLPPGVVPGTADATQQAFLQEGTGQGSWSSSEKRNLFASLRQIADAKSSGMSLQTDTEDSSSDAASGWTSNEKQQLLGVLGQLVQSEKANGLLLRRRSGAGEGSSTMAQDGTQAAAWTVSEKTNLLDNFGRLVDSELQLVIAVETLGGGQPAKVSAKQPPAVTKEIDLTKLQSRIFPGQDPR